MDATDIDSTAGLPGGTTESAADAAERERLLREAMDAREEADAIFEGMADGVIVCDSQGRLLRMNAAYRQLLGLEEHEDDVRSAEGRGQLFQPRDSTGRPLAAHERPMARILRGEVLTDKEASDIQVHTGDGHEAILNATGRPLCDVAGRIIGGIAIFRDVTERRRLERRTQESLAALLAMAETLVQIHEPAAAGAAHAPDEDRASPAGAMAQRLLDLALSILGEFRGAFIGVDVPAGSLRTIALAGQSAQEHAHRHAILEDWWRDRSLSDEQIEALRRGEPRIVDLAQSSYLNRQKGPATTLCLLVPMRSRGDLIGFLALDRDVRRQRYTDEALSLARAVARMGALVLEHEQLLRDRAEAEARELALQETNRRMNEFLGIAGHEFRTPLTTIAANAQMAERRLGRAATAGGDAQLQALFAGTGEMLRRIRQQTTRLDRLVSDLLDISRIQTGQLALRPDPCDLAALAREMIEEQRQINPARTIAFAVPSAQPIMVYADRERIGQVITNFLTNALKYSRDDCPVHAGIDAEARGGAPWIQMWVRDEGPGLAAEDQERIWERFYRAQGVEIQSGSGVGLGLGLYISHTIIDRHDGRIGVDSVRGKGSTFWFSLPLYATQ